ncbi:transposase [Streptomyces fulvoviolaceus]|uniref:transposase n=1 Tax=Streptomyces fulvoviolaceus TaxID=285535 RepID=UPI000694F349|nr:transposase [Streptomyces fulvoviolaceus]
MVQALTVTDLGVDFPHAAQVAKIVRHRTSAKTGKRTRETVYVITDLTSRQASPERIAQIARSQWVIENRLHFVRDTAFREDVSKVRDTDRRTWPLLREMSLRPFERPLNLLGLS